LKLQCKKEWQIVTGRSFQKTVLCIAFGIFRARSLFIKLKLGPILGQIFSSIIDGRLRRGLVKNLRQKCFRLENGCKINMELLNADLDHSKRNKSGVFTIVDISKAFDAVPHSAIKPILARKGIPTPISDIIIEMYKDCKTSILAKSNEGSRGGSSLVDSGLPSISRVFSGSYICPSLRIRL
jgi:hypothetical protein